MNMNTDRHQWQRTKMRTLCVSHPISSHRAPHQYIIWARILWGKLVYPILYIIILLLLSSSFCLLASFGKCENFNKFYFCRRSQITGWHLKYLDSNVAQLFLSPREQRTKTTKTTNNNNKKKSVRKNSQANSQANTAKDRRPLKSLRGLVDVCGPHFCTIKATIGGAGGATLPRNN